MATTLEVKYFNSFMMKKVEKSGTAPTTKSDPVWPGLEWDPFGYPAFPIQASYNGDGGDPNYDSNWYIEEARIKGGFNNTMISQGVRAYLNEEEPQQDTRESSLIYSGVYNSRTEINQTNVFSIGENISTSLDPHNGSVQRLFATDSNLIILQENKVSQILIDKDVVYTTEGGTQTLPPGTVLGQVVPYAGRYGIGTNPESFASFGNRKYFVDPYRGTVMRLSIDGLTEISGYGMKDYFRDQLTDMDNLYKTSSKTWSFNLTSLHSGATLSNITTPLAFGTIGVYTPTFTTTNSTPGAFAISANVTGASAVTITITNPGSVFVVGDTITINSGQLGFGSSGPVITLTEADFVPTTTLTSFDVTGIEQCQTFIGSKVLTLDGSTIVDTGANITNVVSAGGSVYTITVSQPIILQPSGFFSFDYKSKIVGGWDNFNRYYTISMQPTPTYVDLQTNYGTLSYDENVRGWVSFFTFKPSFIFSLKGQTYSTVDYSLYNHYQNTNNGNFGVFYGVANSSTINFLVNANPSTRKVFQTINYEGDNGWKITSMQSDLTRTNQKPNTVSADLSSVVYSYDEGLYVDPNSGYPQRAGFNKKENLYTAPIKNASLFQNGQVIPGTAVTGLKGYLLDVTFSTDETTYPNGPKELWSVGTTFVQSS